MSISGTEALTAFVLPGVSNLLVSLGYIGRRIVLGHTLNTQTIRKTDEEKKKALNKFKILCWAAFIAILGLMRPTGCGLDTPVRLFQGCLLSEQSQKIGVMSASR